MEYPEWLRNGMRWFLGLDGFFHLGEMGLAIYEEAYITASVLGISAMGMFLACKVLGEEHTHQHHHH